MGLQQYDIIGDVHGRADELQDVLTQLGYHKEGRGYRHPAGRKAVFLGDFIDRGTQHKRVLEIVRSMVDTGDAQAIMGNHEFNAICYAEKMPDGSDGSGDYVRSHTLNNRHNHDLFLSEFPFGTLEYNEIINWFKDLPLFVDLDEFRAVHACWDDDSFDVIKPYLNEDNTLKDEAYQIYGSGEGPVFEALEMLLKAPEVALPEGMSYSDPHGTTRYRSRVLWWRSADLVAAERIDTRGCDFDEQQEKTLNSKASIKDAFMSAAKSTFIGHYALPADGYEYSDDVAVLDYVGQVTAYRWPFDKKAFSSKNFVCA